MGSVDATMLRLELAPQALEVLPTILLSPGLYQEITVAHRRRAAAFNRLRDKTKAAQYICLFLAAPSIDWTAAV
jgi:hypothetical protein